jgi:tetratricopeptide (TPR) repeat protein
MNSHKPIIIDAEIAYMQGNEKLENKEYNAAIHCYSKAIAIDPKHDAAYINRAKAYSHYFAEMKAIDAYIDYTNGMNEYENKNYNEAIKHFSDALVINPQHKNAFQYCRKAVDAKNKIEALEKACAELSVFGEEIEEVVEELDDEAIIEPPVKKQRTTPWVCSDDSSVKDFSVFRSIFSKNVPDSSSVDWEEDSSSENSSDSSNDLSELSRKRKR